MLPKSLQTVSMWDLTCVSPWTLSTCSADSWLGSRSLQAVVFHGSMSTICLGAFSDGFIMCNKDILVDIQISLSNKVGNLFNFETFKSKSRIYQNFYPFFVLSKNVNFIFSICFFHLLKYFLDF